jgi:hypothetical protein
MKYQKEHYEDVARVLRTATKCLCQRFASEGWFAPDRFDRCDIVSAFADLFAADNPRRCTYCIYLEGTTEFCDPANGQHRDAHNFEGGFDREQFLAACGLES